MAVNLKFYKSFVFYLVSNGLNRGAALLYLPILSASLSLEGYGVYSIAQLTSQLLIPFFTLNGSVAIMREGSEKVETGYSLLIAFSITTFLCGIVYSASTFIFDYSNHLWISFAVINAVIEGLQLNLLTYMRCQGKDGSYLLFICLKVLGLLGIIIIGKVYNWSLFDLFLAQVLFYAVLLVFYSFRTYQWNINLKFDTSIIRKVLPYTLGFLPHSFFQWILSNSDRFIIKYIEGENQLGIYSIAYNLSMVIMLINSGIALTLPQNIFKNYKKWIETNLRKKTLRLYGIAVIVAFVFLLLAMELDKHYFHVIKIYSPLLVLLVGLISSGIYILGVYYFYGNYILYHRKTLTLTKQTGITAVVGIILTYFLVSAFGIIGAAISTFISYVLYTILVIIAAIKLEPVIKHKLGSELVIVPIIFFLMMLVTAVFYLYSL